ncbi:MAG: ArsR family transcriptional regulator [Nitrosarchaeum sp.]
MLNVSFPTFSFYHPSPKNIFHFIDSITGRNNSKDDPRFKMILWSVIAGTRGGINRAKILNLLATMPVNANKISTILNLDHKTVIHHVNILTKNELIVKEEKDYGATYNLTQIMKDNQNTLMEIMEKIGTK